MRHADTSRTSSRPQRGCSNDAVRQDGVRERAKESEPGADVSTPEKVIAAFDAKIDAVDFVKAKEDVLSYVTDVSELDIWSREFFRQMVRKIEFKS